MRKRLNYAVKFSLFLFLAVPVAQAGVAETYVLSSYSQSYIYVFSGKVFCDENPCANAVVHVNLVPARFEEVSGATKTQRDGSYFLEVIAPGSPNEMTDWKLSAELPDSADRDAAQLEGRLILPSSGHIITVERPIALVRS